MKFVLVFNCERHIFKPEFFETKEAAHNAMCFHIDSLFGTDSGETKKLYEAEKGEDNEYYGGDFGVTEDGAWIDYDAIFAGDAEEGNWDFSIFEMV